MKDECYEFIKGPNNKISIVGFGSYGEVKLAKNSETGEIVAIKMIHGRNAKQQIDVHHKLNHPNIIKLINYYYEKDKNVTYMVLEFAQSGSLHDTIKFGYGQLPKPKVKRYFRDVCKAVQYLHSLKYMHRDIKPQNILLTKDDHCKLCDFGFAAILEYRSTLCGTYQYMAPQMIQQKPYDYKVDIWALGILLFQLIQGSAPFRGQTGQDVIGQMKKPIVFSNRFQKQEIQLIKMILRVGAQKRPNVSSILEHSFFRDMDQYQAEEKQIMRMWEMEKQKINEEGSGSKFSTTQSSRTGSSWSTPNNLDMGERGKQKPTSQQSYKPGDKDFKYFVPQGVKANTAIGPGKGNFTGMSSNAGQGQYQNFNNSSQFSNASNSGTSGGGGMNLNNSSSSAYRANQIPTGSFNNQAKNNPIIGTKGMGMPGLTSPTSMQNQARSNVPIYTAHNSNFQQTPQMGNNQPGLSQNQWRKH